VTAPAQLPDLEPANPYPSRRVLVGKRSRYVESVVGQDVSIGNIERKL
jgi:hypothetical protein